MPWIERKCQNCGEKFYIASWRRRGMEVLYCPGCSYVLATIENLRAVNHQPMGRDGEEKSK